MNLSTVATITLQAWLLSAQTAWQQLVTGNLVTSVSYSQGDGAKSVTRTPADLAQLRAWIASLEAELQARGLLLNPRPSRRAIGVRF